MSSAGLYRTIARGDLLLFVALAIPGLGSLILELLIRLNAALGLGGSLSIDAGLILFLHLVGLMGAGFAFLRLQYAPTVIAIRTAVVVKLGAACLFGLAVSKGALTVLAVFGAIDLLQGMALLMLHSQEVRQRLS
jgi:hypothetical protein